MNATYTISDMAAEFGVTLRALRFYEGRRLLSPSRQGLARVYSDDDRQRLGQIVTWTKQGFTLLEIRTALSSGGFTPEKVAAQIEHLRKQRAETDLAIAQLEQQVAA